MKTLLTFLWLLLASLRLAVAQPTLDATNHTNTSSGGTTTTVTVSTSAGNEVVSVISVIGTTSSGGTETASISGCSLSWSPLVSFSYVDNGGFTVGIMGFYAFSSSIVSTCTATVTSALTIDDASTIQFAVAGTHTAAPIDPNGSLPSTNHVATSTTSGSCGTGKVGGVFSTSLAHDLVLMINSSNNINVTTGTPCNSETKYLGVANSGGTRFSYLYSQWQSYTATQSSVTMAQTTGSSGGPPGTAIVAFTADTASTPSNKTVFKGFP